MEIKTRNNPYYDDYEPSKNYVKILFKPNTSVQSRELNQLQTSLSQQISHFGNHIFKNGSIIMGGNTSYEELNYYKVDSIRRGGDFYTYNTNDEVYTEVPNIISIGDKLVWYDDSNIIGTATIKHIDNDILWFKITSGTPDVMDANGNSREITIKSSEDIYDNYEKGKITFVPKVYRGVRFSIEETIMYIDGHFLYLDKNDYFYKNAYPSVRFGITYEHNIITSNDDESLLDPANNVYNYASAGADRYQIHVKLDVNPYNFKFIPEEYESAGDTSLLDEMRYQYHSSENFIELMRVYNGKVLNKITHTDYNTIEDTLARRTYEKNGDYTVNPFEISVSLKQPKVPADGEFKYNEDDTKDMLLELTNGKAYVKGYEFTRTGNSYIPIPKARDYREEDNVISIGQGDYILIESPQGNPELSNRKMITFYDASDEIIGSAFTNGIQYHNTITGFTIYKLYLIKINMNKVYYNNEVISEKKFSDSTYIKTNNGFQADISFRAYKNNVPVVNQNDGNTNSSLIKIPNEYIKENKKVDIYLTKKFTGSFAGSGQITTSYVSNVSTDQYFVPTGNWSNTDVNNNIFAVVTKNNGGGPSENTVLTYDDGLRVRSIDASTLEITYDNETNFGTGGGNEVIFFTRVRILNKNSKIKTRRIATHRATDSNKQKIYLPKVDGYDVIMIKTISPLAKTNKDIENNEDATDYTSQYKFHNGQKDDIYDFAYLEWIGDGNPPSDSLYIKYRYFRHEGTGYFDVNSYTDIPYSKIPKYKTNQGNEYRLSDVLDFRPMIKDEQTCYTDLLPVYNTNIDITYDHYLPRKDILVATKEKKFKLITGSSSLNPEYPIESDNALTLYKIDVNPYTIGTKDITTHYVDNQRYTMADKRLMEKRIESIEYYNSVNQLERKAENDTTSKLYSGLLEKFKSGILVDSFQDFTVSDTENQDYLCSIDLTTQTLRPKFSTENPYDLVVNQDKSNNIKVSNGKILPNYIEEGLVKQDYTSGPLTINPYNENAKVGSLTLSPSSDVWVDQGTPINVRNNQSSDNEYNYWINRIIGMSERELIDSGGSINSTEDEIVKRINGLTTKKINHTYARPRTVSFIASGLKPRDSYYINIPVDRYIGYKELILNKNISNVTSGEDVISGNKRGIIAHSHNNVVFVKDEQADFTTGKSFVKGDVITINNEEFRIILTRINVDNVKANDYGVICGEFDISSNSLPTGTNEIVISNSMGSIGSSYANEFYMTEGVEESEINFEVSIERDDGLDNDIEEPVIEEEPELTNFIIFGIASNGINLLEPNVVQLRINMFPAGSVKVEYGIGEDRVNEIWGSDGENRTSHIVEIPDLNYETEYSFTLVGHSSDNTYTQQLDPRYFTTNAEVIEPDPNVPEFDEVPHTVSKTETSINIQWSTVNETISEVNLQIDGEDNRFMGSTALSKYHEVVVNESCGLRENDPPQEVNIGIKLKNEENVYRMNGEYYWYNDTIVAGEIEEDIPDEEPITDDFEPETDEEPITDDFEPEPEPDNDTTPSDDEPISSDTVTDEFSLVWQFKDIDLTFDADVTLENDSSYGEWVLPSKTLRFTFPSEAPYNFCRLTLVAVDIWDGDYGLNPVNGSRIYRSEYLPIENNSNGSRTINITPPFLNIDLGMNIGENNLHELNPPNEVRGSLWAKKGRIRIEMDVKVDKDDGSYTSLSDHETGSILISGQNIEIPDDMNDPCDVDTSTSEYNRLNPFYNELFGRDVCQEGLDYWPKQTFYEDDELLREALIAAANSDDLAYYNEHHVSSDSGTTDYVSRSAYYNVLSWDTESDIRTSMNILMYGDDNVTINGTTFSGLGDSVEARRTITYDIIAGTLIGIASDKFEQFVRMYWDEAGYLRLNPDVAEGVDDGNIDSGLSHYLQYGVHEQRIWWD